MRRSRSRVGFDFSCDQNLVKLALIFPDDDRADLHLLVDKALHVAQQGDELPPLESPRNGVSLSAVNSAHMAYDQGGIKTHKAIEALFF
jgi:hypothetical protein